MSTGEMERRVESLQRLVNEANALALVGSREHGIDVQLSLDPRRDRVFVDRIQIQQVLVNLIRNAIEAMMDARSLPCIRTTRDGDDFVEVTSRIPVGDRRSGRRRNSSSRSSRPNRMAWASAFRSAGRSSRRTVAESGSSRADGGTAFHFTLPSGESEEMSDEERVWFIWSTMTSNPPLGQLRAQDVRLPGAGLRERQRAAEVSRRISRAGCILSTSACLAWTASRFRRR